MRIASFRNHSGDIRTAAYLNGRLLDLGAVFERFLVDREGCDVVTALRIADERMPGSMLALIRRGAEGQADLRLIAAYLAARGDAPEMPPYSSSGRRISYAVEEVALLAPVPQLHGCVFNMEYNYDSYRLVHDTVPPDDGKCAMFIMNPETVVGTGDDILWPHTATEVTSAVELGVIIGKEGKRIPQGRALDHVFGYTIVNDLTGISLYRGIGPERLCFPKGFYFSRAMVMDTFQPVGPFIALQDGLADPQGLRAELRVNGTVVSMGTTSEMRCSVARLIEFLSEDITLKPGDLISTGAIGTFAHPPEASVVVGDVIEAEIEHIGVVRNRVVAQR
jgi:2-keto-4-pentenoate hydratase/2-oxohepta-3-ene-1,7-dioic acid hydratase in catechol pathway